MIEEYNEYNVEYDDCDELHDTLKDCTIEIDRYVEKLKKEVENENGK